MSRHCPLPEFETLQHCQDSPLVAQICLYYLLRLRPCSASRSSFAMALIATCMFCVLVFGVTSLMALCLKNETTFSSCWIGSSDREDATGGLWTGWILLSQDLGFDDGA